MISRNQIKYLSSLKEKKIRDYYGEFLVEGEKSVKEFLMYPEFVKAVYALPEWINANDISDEITSEICQVSQTELDRISSLKTPNKVALLARKPSDNDNVNFNNLILALDEIKDPGNLGTIIRIADWFGIDDIVCSPGTVDPYNPKTVQASMGSLCRVKITEMILADFFEKLPAEFPVFGTFLNAESVDNSTLPGKAVIVIGNESKGLSPQINKYITHRISISRKNHPLAVKGQADSLNAAIATSIICYEFRRQNKI